MRVVWLLVLVFAGIQAHALSGVAELSSGSPGAADKDGKDEADQPFQSELPSAEDTGRFISDESWNAAKDLMESNRTAMPQHRAIVAVMGTFEFEGAHNMEDDLGESNDLGESAGPVLMPAAAKAQIRAAQALVANDVEGEKKREYAKQYLSDVEHSRNQLESKTVEDLSVKLAAAQKKLGVLMQVEAEANQMLLDPKVGRTLPFDVGVGKLKVKIEGWRYSDGNKFYAPQGTHATEEGCNRFMSEKIDKDLVFAAMKKRDAIHKEMEIAKGKVSTLEAELKELPAEVQDEEDELGDSKEISQAAEKKRELERKIFRMHQEIKALEKEYDLASETVLKRQQSALNAASNYVRDANFRARELELSERERKMTDREMHLKSATEQLEATAEQLKKAHETQLVVEFPQMQEELRLKQKQLDKREEEIKHREQSLAQQAKVMKAKIGAFNNGVAQTIEKSMHSAPREADKWDHKSKARISTEVDSFSNMLTSINDKFSVGHGAKIADRIAKSVSHGVNEIKEITLDMDKAAQRAAEDGAAGKPLDTTKDSDGGVSGVENGVDTDDSGTIDDANVQNEANNDP